MPTIDDALLARHAALTARDLDPWGEDDSVLGVPFVYCHSHLRAHSTGWCTVAVGDKTPLAATDHETATAEAREMGLYIFGDPKPCVHCGAMIVNPVDGDSYRDADGNTRCQPGEKSSRWHSPYARY